MNKLTFNDIKRVLLFIQWKQRKGCIVSPHFFGNGERKRNKDSGKERLHLSQHLADSVQRAFDFWLWGQEFEPRGAEIT